MEGVCKPGPAASAAMLPALVHPRGQPAQTMAASSTSRNGGSAPPLSPQLNLSLSRTTSGSGLGPIGGRPPTAPPVEPHQQQQQATGLSATDLITQLVAEEVRTQLVKTGLLDGSMAGSLGSLNPRNVGELVRQILGRQHADVAANAADMAACAGSWPAPGGGAAEPGPGSQSTLQRSLSASALGGGSPYGQAQQHCQAHVPGAAGRPDPVHHGAGLRGSQAAMSQPTHPGWEDGCGGGQRLGPSPQPKLQTLPTDAAQSSGCASSAMSSAQGGSSGVTMPSGQLTCAADTSRSSEDACASGYEMAVPTASLLDDFDLEASAAAQAAVGSEGGGGSSSVPPLPGATKSSGLNDDFFAELMETFPRGQVQHGAGVALEDPLAKWSNLLDDDLVQAAGNKCSPMQDDMAADVVELSDQEDGDPGRQAAWRQYKASAGSKRMSAELEDLIQELSGSGPQPLATPPLKRSSSGPVLTSTLYHGGSRGSTPPHDGRLLRSESGLSESASPSHRGPGERKKGVTAAPDYQSSRAKKRRERINERLRKLQQLVPEGSKMDTLTMLEKAFDYVKYLKLLIEVLRTDMLWSKEGEDDGSSQSMLQDLVARRDGNPKEAVQAEASLAQLQQLAETFRMLPPVPSVPASQQS
eukprot:SM000163S02310  [mRNA]  locus=s163:100172:102757:+ [translate_table: standard]